MNSQTTVIRDSSCIEIFAVVALCHLFFRIPSNSLFRTVISSRFQFNLWQSRSSLMCVMLAEVALQRNSHHPSSIDEVVRVSYTQHWLPEVE